MAFKLNIKWGKELYKDVEVNTNEPPIVFKAQLFALTNVQPEKQKIMLKGQTLNDESWSNFLSHLKNGLTLMMMGTVDSQIPQAPVEQTKFIEDLSENQLAVAMDLPVGLKNLGNTCYLNAVVQCLKTVPELVTNLNQFKASSSHGDVQTNLVASLRETYEYMDKYKQNGYAPFMLVQLLRLVFPQFSAQTEHGHFMQQDANECWTELLRVLQQKLPPIQGTKKYTNLVDEYFSGEFTCTLKNDESKDEQEQIMHESFLQLSCFISPEVKYLHTGLKAKLEEKLTKFSSTLSRDAVYTKISRISRLPAYVSIQYVRFCYKEKEKVNAKILKDVKFTINLDLFEMCSKDLQDKLIPMREKFRIADEKRAREAKKAKLNENLNDKKSQVASAQNSSPIEYESYSFEDDPGSNNSGLYELKAVLTHKGRSSNSGHYVGWARDGKNGDGDNWLMFDDDTVHIVSEEDILKLSGGGDWHTVYLLLYGPRKLDTNYYKQALQEQEPAVNQVKQGEKMVI